jgi:hypothetical protein
MAHKRGHKRSRRHSRKNILGQSVSVIKGTSKKYMPKVKHGLENIGEKVITTSEQSVPFLQRMTRKLFSMIGIKSRKNRK